MFRAYLFSGIQTNRTERHWHRRRLACPFPYNSGCPREKCAGNCWSVHICASCPRARLSKLLSIGPKANNFTSAFQIHQLSDTNHIKAPLFGRSSSVRVYPLLRSTSYGALTIINPLKSKHLTLGQTICYSDMSACALLFPPTLQEAAGDAIYTSYLNIPPVSQGCHPLLTLQRGPVGDTAISHEYTRFMASYSRRGILIGWKRPCDKRSFRGKVCTHFVSWAIGPKCSTATRRMLTSHALMPLRWHARWPIMRTLAAATLGLRCWTKRRLAARASVLCR